MREHWPFCCPGEHPTGHPVDSGSSDFGGRTVDSNPQLDFTAWRSSPTRKLWINVKLNAVHFTNGSPG